MRKLKVIGAYVTLRVRNELGQEVVQGFYEGATVSGEVNQEDLERHLRKGLLEAESGPAPRVETKPATKARS